MTVFLAVIFMFSSLSIPAFADDSIVADVIEDIVELPDDFLAEDPDEQQPDIPAENIEVEVGEDLENSEPSDGEEITEESDTYVDDDNVIDLYALEDNYFDLEAFNSKPKVYSQNFEGDFNTRNIGSDLDVYGNIELSEDVSVIKASQARYGDGEGEGAGDGEVLQRGSALCGGRSSGKRA